MRWPVWLIGLVWLGVGVAYLRDFAPGGLSPEETVRQVWEHIQDVVDRIER